MFYSFDQNNSGGSFSYDTMGITRLVIIEADGVDEACVIARTIGIYFNGVEDERDCPCCGDRWHMPWDSNGDEVPCQYGEPIHLNTQPLVHAVAKLLPDEMPQPKSQQDIVDKELGTVIHYKDGTVLWVKDEPDEPKIW